jgi:hypothetical protein
MMRRTRAGRPVVLKRNSGIRGFGDTGPHRAAVRYTIFGVFLLEVADVRVATSGKDPADHLSRVRIPRGHAELDRAESGTFRISA